VVVLAAVVGIVRICGWRSELRMMIVKSHKTRDYHFEYYFYYAKKVKVSHRSVAAFDFVCFGVHE
jgi:hypothetical protein